ncbi:hypothetical protein AB0B31_36615 [Catellatospora citrea]|uniref:hypothetical protein n=1 Tax=Catellatospora citrea TaxID=53366 RepID=UPI003402FD69
MHLNILARWRSDDPPAWNLPNQHTFDALTLVWTACRERISARRTATVLRSARRHFRNNAEAIRRIDCVDDKGRALLTAMTRKTEVYQSASLPPLGLAMLGLLALAAITLTSLVLPPLVLASTASANLDNAGLALAGAVYLIAYAWVGAFHLRRLRIKPVVRLLKLGVKVGTVICLLAFVTLAVPAASRAGIGALITPIAFGLAAGAVSVAAAWLCIRLALAMTTPVNGFIFRRCGMLPPSRLVARRLLPVLIQLSEAKGSAGRGDVRRELLITLRHSAEMIEYWVPHTLYWSGVRGHGLAEARMNCRRAAAVVRTFQWDLLDAGDAASHAMLKREIADAAVKLCRGDWSTLTTAEEPTRSARVAALARRLVTPLALVGAGVTVPYLPGADQLGSAATTIQAGLFIAALLHLVSVDGPAQDRILAAFKGE